MSDTETEPQALPGDGLREGIVDELRRRIGDHLVDTELKPNDDLWVRVATAAWKDDGEALYQMGFEYFCFLSAIDWMPSPYGRGEDDPTEPPPERDDRDPPGRDRRRHALPGLRPGDRHPAPRRRDDQGRRPRRRPRPSSRGSPSSPAPTGTSARPHEMFGIDFAGHPDLRNMYLPTEFEGFPLRKDFPLLARMVKPWPGIVDVEPMPAEEAPPEDAVAGEAAPASPTPDQADAGLGDAAAEDAAAAAAVAHSVEEAPDHVAPPAGDAPDRLRRPAGPRRREPGRCGLDRDHRLAPRCGRRDRRGRADHRRVGVDAHRWRTRAPRTTTRRRRRPTRQTRPAPSSAARSTIPSATRSSEPEPAEDVDAPAEEGTEPT